MATDRKIVQMKLTQEDYAMIQTVRAHHNLTSDVDVVRHLLIHEVRRIEDYLNSRPKPKAPRKPKNPAE